MVERLFHMVLGEELMGNNLKISDKPIIGISFDWRLDPSTKRYSFVQLFYDMYKQAIENAGGILYVVTWDENLEDFKDIIDGWIIPGGRDIHPKFYGQELKGSIVGENADIHYDFNKKLYYGLPSMCPILGVCWGFQFLNIINGGSMIQDMHDKAEHYKKRKIEFKKGTWFHENVGEYSLGNCYHHQVLDKLGENIEVAGYDDSSKTAHAIELNDKNRQVFGVLWHPELSFKDESRQAYEETSVKIFSAFVKLCAQYKQSKAQK